MLSTRDKFRITLLSLFASLALALSIGCGQHNPACNCCPACKCDLCQSVEPKPAN